MIIFKTFFKLVNKNKSHLILYTALLIVFTCITLSSNQTNMNYVDSKPDVIIVDNDNTKLSEHLKKYFEKNSNLKETVKNIDDELFYRFSSYAIYIPKGFEQSVIDKNIKEIKFKTVDDYNANLANILLNKYLSSLEIYKDISSNIDELMNNIDISLESKSTININSNLNTTELSKASFYYSFMNYSLLAGCIYVLVVIISVFRENNISKRNIISSINYNKLNRQLFFSSVLFGIIMWLIYILISFIIVGETMITANGLCMIAVSFIFLIYCLSIGFFIVNILNNKNAINGIINTIALGTSFLCGCFVSLDFLPKSVLAISKFIPNYYYIKTINQLTNIENINFSTLIPLLPNILILIISSILLLIISTFIAKKKRKIA